MGMASGGSTRPAVCHGPISEVYATSKTALDGSCHNLASHVILLPEKNKKANKADT